MSGSGTPVVGQKEGEAAVACKADSSSCKYHEYGSDDDELDAEAVTAVNSNANRELGIIINSSNNNNCNECCQSSSYYYLCMN